ncbi:NAD(P)-binding protein, partial [Priestia megaterium]|nr:NAD(P)-binding protein [Priestia megaterium]
MGDLYNTIVIGAGQAGLAIGYYLKQKSLSFLIIDSNSRVGDSWR